ncbi:hypothetical protein GXW82_16785 [Streptacidiphilus sp. 4-A2]|nr:hypothetical protein [Streptacidiphilus sp. 4-A2]
MCDIAPFGYGYLRPVFQYGDRPTPIRSPGLVVTVETINRIAVEVDS